MKKIFLLLAVVLFVSCEKTETTKGIEVKEQQKEAVFPKADFNINPSIDVGTHITVENNSTDEDTQIWVLIDEGMHTTDKSYDFTTTFIHSGVYTVILFVSNEFGSDVKIKSFNVT